MKYFYLLLKGVILMALLLVTIRNTHWVTFNGVLNQHVELPLIVLLLIFFVIGCIFGVLAMLGRILRLRNEAGRLRRDLKKSARIGEVDLAVPPAPSPPATTNQPTVPPVQP